MDKGKTGKLKALSDLLLSESSSHDELLDAAKGLYSLFAEAAGEAEPEADPLWAPESRLPDGKAISPRDAARCAKDPMRTAAFLRGIRGAIIEARDKFPGERIRILYAGCGPFATLAIPLCTQFKPSEIILSLIDIHALSIASAQKCIRGFGLDEYFGEMTGEDILSFKAKEKYHIIIAEVMQRALDSEPQVAATIHLSQFLRDSGIFIPEKVSIRAALANLGHEFSAGGERERIDLGLVFELTKDSRQFGKTSLALPRFEAAGFSLILQTGITTFGGHKLSDYDSGLSYPKILSPFEKRHSRRKIEFDYRMGENPGFGYQIR